MFPAFRNPLSVSITTNSFSNYLFQENEEDKKKKKKEKRSGMGRAGCKTNFGGFK